MIWDLMKGRERGSGDMKNPPQGREMMIRSPYKNISVKLEKGVYVCVYLLYGTYVFGFCFLFFSFSSFLGTKLDMFFLCVWCPAPCLPPFTENYTKQRAVSTFLSLFALNSFRKRTGGGGFLLLLCSTLVIFCTWKPHRGFLIFDFFLY